MNQNQKNDRKLIAWTTLLLCAEVVWLLLHMQILPNSFFQNSSASETLPAGTIQITQHEVRRRNLNSLVWENSEPQDTIYFYDSILTLSQSSATLALEQQTEIHLSENTLVTIEPQEQASNDQIRLRFSHGDLRARNPLQTAKIEATEWNLNIQKGSEMNLRQTGEQDYEVEVLKGHLQVQSAEGTKSLGQNEVLKINNNKLGETLALEKDLQFSGTPSERIYSAEENVTVPIAWKGNADKIEIIRQGQKSEEKSLRPDQLSENLPLTFGKYTLRLMKDGKVSAAKEIEIWKTPVIQLLSPFPRDRVKTDESIVFVWSHVPEVAKYQFVIKDLDTKDSVDNFMFYTFNKEGHFEWTVQGRDQDGFLIPPSYFNQIYSLNNPLAAPKLKSPSLRKPAGKKTDKATDKKNHQSSWHKKMFWLSFFLPAAQAQETHEQNDYEAVFDWESVDGADQYTIEISDTADFRKPRVSETVKQTEFVWSQFPLGTYYWRVAGQTRRGRLGLFSEAAKSI